MTSRLKLFGDYVYLPNTNSFAGSKTDPLVVAHSEILQFGFGFAFRVVRSEVAFELGEEIGVTIKPIGGVHGGQAGFEPIECSSF